MRSPLGPVIVAWASRAHQGHGQARGADEQGIAVGHEDRVIAIVARADQALAVLHGQQAVTGAEVPAPRPLEQVAADRGHVADLGRADFDGRLPERRVSLADLRAGDDVGQPGARRRSSGRSTLASPEMPASSLMSFR